MISPKHCLLLITTVYMIMAVSCTETDCDRGKTENAPINENTEPPNTTPSDTLKIKETKENHENSETRLKRQAVYKAHFPHSLVSNRGPDRQINLRPAPNNIPIRYLSNNNNNFNRNTYRTSSAKRRQPSRPITRANPKVIVKRKKIKTPPVMF